MDGQEASCSLLFSANVTEKKKKQTRRKDQKTTECCVGEVNTVIGQAQPTRLIIVLIISLLKE